MERLMSLRGQYPYRCYDCDRRFYAVHYDQPKGVKPAEKRRHHDEQDED
jgi:hypothetical protein